MVCFLLVWFALSARAEDWEQQTYGTAEGGELVVAKRGRTAYSMRITGSERGDAIVCSSGFYGLPRVTAALAIRTAGRRSEGETQVGPVLAFADAMEVLHSDEAIARAAALGMPFCALGIDSFPGAVVLTLGSAYKAQGRTATLSPAEASSLADWMMGRSEIGVTSAPIAKPATTYVISALDANAGTIQLRQSYGGVATAGGSYLCRLSPTLLTRLTVGNQMSTLTPRADPWTFDYPLASSSLVLDMTGCAAPPVGMAAPAVAAIATGSSGAVQVTFTAEPFPFKVEVRCGTFAAQSPLTAGSATIPDVPASSDCKLFPKGGVTATSFPITAGASYECAIIGTTTSCTRN